MRHPSAWYVALADKLGHPSYVTLAEITEAEVEEAWQSRTISATTPAPGGLPAGEDLTVYSRALRGPVVNRTA
jgi:hypothetical protein